MYCNMTCCPRSKKHELALGAHLITWHIIGMRIIAYPLDRGDGVLKHVLPAASACLPASGNAKMVDFRGANPRVTDKDLLLYFAVTSFLGFT